MSDLAIYNGPEDPENCVGFIQATASGFEAFDTGKNPLGVFANDNDACDAIWSTYWA